jgi:lysozyme family protein
MRRPAILALRDDRDEPPRHDVDRVVVGCEFGQAVAHTLAPGHDAWTRCCLDALIDCAPHAARWTDWTIGGVLTLLEEYNGLGYAARGVPSAYVWSGTDQYESGKFVADHVCRAGVKDVREGGAPLLAMMMAIDPSIEINGLAEAA